MNWKKLLTSPPPAAVWLLEGHRIAYLCRDRKGQLSGRSHDLDESLFEVGPVGLQTVDAERLGAVLDGVLNGFNCPSKVAVIVPTGWLRSHLLTFDKLPPSKAEIEDIVRWRLKKMLPVRPSDLRLAIVPAETSGTQQRVLCLSGMERAVSVLESVFESRGIQIGQLTGFLFALANGEVHDATDPHLYVQSEETFVSFLLSVGGSALLVRMKPLPTDGLTGPHLERELQLMWSYVQNELNSPAQIKVTLSCQDAEEQLRSWWLQCEGAKIEEEQVALQHEEWYAALGKVRSAAALAIVGQETSE
ncbi:MAG: hypothetical protein GY906_17290 [bacterium]|nr:hypothetical protein [bacterium]